MTPRAEHLPSSDETVADGTRAVPLAVTTFLVLDVVTTLIGQASGLPDLGPTGPVPALQMFLVPVAAAATMWGRTRAAVVLSAAVFALAFILGPTGEELWLEVVIAVTVAIRADRRRLGWLVVGVLAYAAALGLSIESHHAGWGWDAGLVTGSLGVVAVVGGLIAGRLIRARDRRRAEVLQFERERGKIRAVERASLADELQFVVTEGLARLEDELDQVAHGVADGDKLRHALTQVDQHTRSLLTELRTLLELLRREPAADGDATSIRYSASQNWVDLLTARHVRIAATAVFVVLALRAAAAGVAAPSIGIGVEVIGLLACAVAAWRPRLAAAGAAAALTLFLVLGSGSYWDALPITLLCLMGALRFGLERLWVLGVGLAAYCVLLAAIGADQRGNHIALDCYAALLGVALGLTARHFVRAREDSVRQLAELTDERSRMQAEERNAVARELHDVVAHSLSVISMLVMATSLSNDRGLLADTLDKVRRSLQSAHHELSTLLHAMRGPGVDQQQPAPLVGPVVSAEALARRLSDNGYRPVLSIDPDADALDSTTQRTLSRIMQEAATNILRYTPAGSTCTFTLTVADCGVRLVIESPLGAEERSSDLSLGWGLRGIRERVELTQGTFAAGPDRDRWLLDVTLPLLAESAITLPSPEESLASARSLGARGSGN